MTTLTPNLGIGRTATARRGGDRLSMGDALRAWPVRFVLFAFACQVGLLFLAGTPLRLPLRVAVYAASLMLLALRPPRHAAHPALRLAVWVPFVLALGLVHPDRNTILAGVGQAALYLAVLAPLAWVASSRPSYGVFRAVVVIVWAVNAASAAVGVLQIYNPGRFQGATSAVVEADANFQNGSAVVVLADGTRTIKPMGLTDVPGGASGGGLNAIVLGTGLLLTSRSRPLRWAAVGGMAVGLFCIFLSQVRVTLVMTIVCSSVTLLVLARRADWGRAAKLATVLGCVAAVGTMWAFAVAGEQTIKRFQTLVADDPGTVFHQNRGQFLQQMVMVDLWKYPFGAGLGRWGMMSYYFGDPSRGMWSEMQWTSWLYDGGIPLVLLNAAMLGVIGWVAWTIGTRRGGPSGLATWGAVVLAYDVAALAGSFVFPIFSVQGGMEVILLNALLFAASRDPAMLRSSPTSGGSGARRPSNRTVTSPSPTPRGWGRAGAAQVTTAGKQTSTIRGGP